MAELLLCCEYMAATTILNQTSSQSLSLVLRNLVPPTVVTERGAVPKTEREVETLISHLMRRISEKLMLRLYGSTRCMRTNG